MEVDDIGPRAQNLSERQSILALHRQMRIIFLEQEPSAARIDQHPSCIFMPKQIVETIGPRCDSRALQGQDRGDEPAQETAHAMSPASGDFEGDKSTGRIGIGPVIAGAGGRVVEGRRLVEEVLRRQ